MKKYLYLLWFILSAALVALDQLVKRAVSANLAPNGVVAVWPGVFEIVYTENRGAAFGLMQNWRVLFLVVTALAAAVICFVLCKRIFAHRLADASLALVLAGALGNFIDRAINGFVVDMFYFRPIDFPVFNVADICVTCGAALFILYYLFFSKRLIGHEPTSEGADDTGKA